MRFGWFIFVVALALPAQVPPQITQSEVVVTCDPPSCHHYYLNGNDFIVLESKEARIAVAVERIKLNPKFLSLTLGVTNLGDDPIDVLPRKFWIGVDTPKRDKLPYVDPEIVAEANHGIDYGTVMKVAMQANTIAKGQALSGSVFFKADKKAESAHAIIEVGLHIFYVPLTLRTSR